MLQFEISIIKATNVDSLVVVYQYRADSFYNVKNYSKALLDCERIIFLSKDYSNKRRALYLQSNCYKQTGEYDKSVNCLKLISSRGLDKEDVFKLYYDIAKFAYMAKYYEESAAQFLKLEALDSVKSYSDNCFLLRILILNEFARWDSAKFLIKKSDFFSSEKKSELIDIYNNKPKIYNKNRIEWYSRIIPGSGQAIIGKPFEGIASFLLCATSLSFGIYNVYYSYYFTGYFLGAGFLNGFYYGGIRRLDLLVENENQRRIQKLNFQVKETFKK